TVRFVYQLIKATGMPDEHTASNRSDFANGTALIIGGSGGLGSAICRRLAAAGSRVTLTYRSDAERASALLAGLRSAGCEAEAHAVDLGDAPRLHAVCAQAAEHGGGIHTVVF